MMTSYVILTTVLIISLILNAIFYWYSRQVVNKLTFIYDNIGDMSELVSNYQVHLKSVYEMEMFYGDETLGGLVEHARSFNEQMDTFDFVYQYADAGEETEQINDNTDKET